jgi:hypothetical protein
LGLITARTGWQQRHYRQPVRHGIIGTDNDQETPNMKKIIFIAAISIAAAAGCSTASAPNPQATVTVTAPPAAASSASPQASSQANANARLLVSALASGNSESVQSARKLVAGPVMTHYIRFQVINAEAWEQSGQGNASASVTATSGGSYQMCYPQGGGCQAFTAFQSDSAGRITGMSVDGQPVADRLATGPSDRGNGLVLTDVGSYLFTSTGQVGVAFRVRNTGNQGVSTGGFQIVFVTSPGNARLSPDLSASSMSSTQALAPGQSASVAAVFDTRKFTGTFIVQSNGGYQTLVSSRLRKPAS